MARGLSTATLSRPTSCSTRTAVPGWPTSVSRGSRTSRRPPSVPCSTWPPSRPTFEPSPTRGGTSVPSRNAPRIPFTGPDPINPPLRISVTSLFPSPYGPPQGAPQGGPQGPRPPATVDSSSSESSAAAGFIGSTRCITFAVSSIVLIWTFGGVVIPRSLSTAAGSDRSRFFNASSAHASATSRPQRSSQSPPRACSVGFSAILCNLQSEGSITAQVTEHDGFPSDFPRAGPPRGHDLARHGEGPSHTSLIEF